MQALWLCTPVHQYIHALEASLTHRSKCKAIAEINNKTPGSGKMQSSNRFSVPPVKNAAFNNWPDLIARMSSRLLGSQSLLNVPGLLPPRQQPAASPCSQVPAQPNPVCARALRSLAPSSRTLTAMWDPPAPVRCGPGCHTQHPWGFRLPRSGDSAAVPCPRAIAAGPSLG